MAANIRIGTRGSQLAVWQADFVTTALRKARPDCNFERVIIKTEGDRDQKSSLTRIGGQGVFTKAIEDALLEHNIDIAVHSLKDLPSQMTEGLMLGAVPRRASVKDVLVTRKGKTLRDLKEKARIATGSIRRRCQLLRQRPDLEMVDLRGNIDTRLRKLQDNDFDALIMAHAALIRLALQKVQYQPFEINEMIPAVGQGAIGIQVRVADEKTRDIVQAVNHEPAMQAVTAERAYLRRLDSGCQFPVGALAEIHNNTIELNGFVSNHDGSRWLQAEQAGPVESAEQIGVKLAEQLIDRGALDILHAFKHNT
ncbi:MAG: hydroxymethylbilane synthase [Caldithrix sp.]|nr:hydroxymethylbilane synthase [Caldithrix sp.]